MTGTAGMSSSGVERSPSPSAVRYDQWYYGVLLSVLASFVGGLGDNLVRYAHNAHRHASDNGGGGPATVSGVEDYDAASVGSLRNSGVWSMGLFLTVVGNTVLTVWSLAFADASLIVPFAALHVIFTVVLAIFINNERLNFLSWTGIGLILGGTFLVVVESNKSSMDYDLDSILEFCMNPPFLSVCLASF